MPAIPEEVREATREGVKIHDLACPARILGRGGKATAMEFVSLTLKRKPRQDTVRYTKRFTIQGYCGYDHRSHRAKGRSERIEGI